MDIQLFVFYLNQYRFEFLLVQIQIETLGQIEVLDFLMISYQSLFDQTFVVFDHKSILIVSIQLSIGWLK